MQACNGIGTCVWPATRCNCTPVVPPTLGCTTTSNKGRMCSKPGSLSGGKRALRVTLKINSQQETHQVPIGCKNGNVHGTDADRSLFFTCSTDSEGRVLAKWTASLVGFPITCKGTPSEDDSNGQGSVASKEIAGTIWVAVECRFYAQ